MDTLAQAFAKAATQTRDYDISRAIISLATEAMWPFRIGRSRLGLDYSIDYMRHSLWIELEVLPEYPFEHVLDDRQMLTASNPEAYLLDIIREPLIKHFRFRPHTEPEDHIVLGEE